ncbi:hypothetical protein GOBAR_DD19679 [Gossypium barbadense]|nr:hypothetical protein GOBAR_DD19679 [Gossypium barbadense]
MEKQLLAQKRQFQEQQECQCLLNLQNAHQGAYNKPVSIDEQITNFKLELIQEFKGSKSDEDSWSYAYKPLAPTVLAFNVSASFKFLKLSYNRVGDPKEHLAYYNNHMNILRASDVIKHRAFSMTLSSTTW